MSQNGSLLTNTVSAGDDQMGAQMTCCCDNSDLHDTKKGEQTCKQLKTRFCWNMEMEGAWEHM